MNNEYNTFNFNDTTGSFHPFEDKSIRKGFIRKVYSLLSIQLLTTFLISLTLNLVDGADKFVVSETGRALMILSIIGTFGLLIMMICNPNSARSSPSNYIILSLFTLFMSYLVGYSTLQYNTKSVLVAFAITGAITISLTLYACQTKYDFTDKGGYLLAILVGLVITGFVNMFIQNNVLQMICAGVGAILFSCYIVYDTQLIVGGSHKKYQFSVDDYVFAAITLYLDIINLFLYLLELIGGRRE